MMFSITKAIHHQAKLLRFTVLGIFFCCLQGELLANSHTVDNKANSAADFTALQAAIDAAAAGDTIYVAGSPTGYSNITVDKKLAIIGAGYKVDNQLGLSTTVNDITLSRKLDEFSNVQSNASGSYFSGLIFRNLQRVTQEYSITGIVVDRCRFTKVHVYSSGLSGISIRNCIFENIRTRRQPSTNTQNVDYNSDVVNIIVSNSIFKSIESNNPSSNVLINHCIFKGGTIRFDDGRYFKALEYVVFTNNIMFNSPATGTSFCTFTNNISYSSNPSAPESETAFVFGTNTGENNIVNTDPLFQNIEGTAFSFLDDFRLQEASPAIGAGSDGTDIGIYGGNFPFPIGGEGEFLMAAPPRVPQIMEMNIQNTSLPVDGTLDVRLKARKQD